MINTETNA